MKKLPRRVLFLFFIVSLAFTGYVSNSYALYVDFVVAPNVLNIQSKSVVVTVHTDIAYSEVVGSSVLLNGVTIDYWKADNRGNFVAKFLSDEVKYLDGLRIDEYNNLVLIGYTTGGESFVGSQDILVVDNLPKGKN